MEVEEDPAAAAVDAIEALARASGKLSRDEIREVLRVSEVGRATLDLAARQLVQNAQGLPLLTSKTADATPVTVVVRTSHTLGGSTTMVRRQGRTKEEFLLKNQFVRSRSAAGEVATSVMLQEPLPLTEGKTAGHIVLACIKDWKTLRELGHNGMCLEHYAFDRLGFQATSRLLLQLHASQKHAFDHLCPPQLAVSLFRLTVFVVITACALHDANNAFKWALAYRFDSKDLLRDAYIAVASIKNSWSIITRNMCEWIALRLGFGDELPEDELEARRNLWVSLDVRADAVDVLVSTLQLRMVDGRIVVNRACAGDHDLVNLITDALKSTWMLTTWSETRFVRVGQSSRAVVAGMLSGLDDLVRFIIDEKKGSLWYLNGWKRMQGNLRVFMVECAIVSRPSEVASSLSF